MTKPTTEECIEWLYKQRSKHDDDEAFLTSPNDADIWMLTDIRAKLIAGEKMAKALQEVIEWDDGTTAITSFRKRNAEKALNAWREAGDL